VLSKKYRVHYTQGNFNNHIGVPLTLLSIKPDCEIAVIEMGANHPGEIKTLANIALPTCGLITNVGKAHLEGFGSLEGVINTKKELYDNLAARGGHVFVNAANPLLMSVLDAKSYTTYSSNPDVEADVNGKLLRCAPYVEFEWNLNNAQCTMHNAQLSTHFVGAYNLDNMLAAITVGLHFGVDEKDICDAISNYVPANNRSQLTKTERNTLIVDAYNANPTSMMAAIDNFDIMEGENKMAILGDMLELGEQSEVEHQNIVHRLMESKIERIILVGKEFKKACETLGVNKFEIIESLGDDFKSQLLVLNSQLILLKGSNGIGLYKLIPYL
jgi:UDP-N-acetylmuramoyl-tripeptide--D-alanyl-D-alanine ligase